MRTFIAIELPKEIKDALGRLEGQLRESGADVKWVMPENIHLTLKFLGEIDDKKIGQINSILEDITKSNAAYRINISSLGAFPKLSSPRVIWVGINEGDKQTKEIAKDLEEKIAKLGIPKENRPFSSHITIGRACSTLNRDRLIQNLENLMDRFGQEGLNFQATAITFFKSTLTPQGPIYEALNKVNLKAT